MSVKGADHSNGGVRIGGTLRAQGFKGILRYACEGRGDVNISRAEANDLKANGIPIALFCEHSAQFLLGGFGVGAERAAASWAVSRAAGIPDGVVYMAADWDCTNGGPTHPGSPGDQNMHKILDALNGAASKIGHQNVGFYGSYFAIDWLVHNAPWIMWYCQTEAWSHGLRHSRANVLQRAATQNVAGVQCDIDELITSNWGQRSASAPPPPPPPPPPREHATGDAVLKLIFHADTRQWEQHPEPGSFQPGSKGGLATFSGGFDEANGHWPTIKGGPWERPPKP